MPQNKTEPVKIDLDELLANFRTARNKAEQINIEADLHCVAPRVIADLLYDAGALAGTYIRRQDYSDIYRPVPTAKPRKAGRKVSFDETEALRQYHEGVTFDEMSRSLGVGADTLSKWAKRRGLTRDVSNRKEKKAMSKFKLRETEEAAIAREEQILASVDAGKRKTPEPPAVSPTCCQPGKAVDVWADFSADRPRIPRKPLTVNEFLALVGKLLTPVLDAEISLNGECVTDVYGYEVKVRGDRVYVDVRTREAGA